MELTKTIAAPAPWKGLPLLAGVGLREVAVPLAVLAIVVVLITPVPPFVLDILLVTDIML